MLNSDGEIEEDQETHAERHARTVSLAEVCTTPTIVCFPLIFSKTVDRSLCPAKWVLDELLFQNLNDQKKKQNKGRQRQRQRLKKVIHCPSLCFVFFSFPPFFFPPNMWGLRSYEVYICGQIPEVTWCFQRRKSKWINKEANKEKA